MASQQSNEYLLGANESELERLRFQHSVWAGITNAFFDRLNVQKGWNCLDAGAGPGFVTFDLRERIGETGSVTALEPSGLFLQHLQKEAEKRGWNNVHALQGTGEQAPLPPRSFDLIFLRWVIAFVPDSAAMIDHLLAALKPGGIIAVQDYWYEGLSLYPQGGAFDRAADLVRAYYRSSGGNAYVTGTVHTYLRKSGLTIVDFKSNQLCGGPASPAAEWMHSFFPSHIPLMAGKGLCSAAEAAAMIQDWHAHRADPEALFFSPLVVDVAGRSQK